MEVDYKWRWARRTRNHDNTLRTNGKQLNFHNWISWRWELVNKQIATNTLSPTRHARIGYAHIMFRSITWWIFDLMGIIFSDYTLTAYTAKFICRLYTDSYDVNKWAFGQHQTCVIWNRNSKTDEFNAFMRMCLGSCLCDCVCVCAPADPFAG